MSLAGTLIRGTVAALLLGPFIGAGEARAQSVAVKPTQIHLSAPAPTALLTLRNDGKRPMRFQITASAWTQSENGEMKLSPTKDVIFFPTFLVVDPGAEKKVRIGTSASFGDVEKTYRIFLEELPPLETETSPGNVEVLTRLGVPIFLRPAKPSEKATLDIGAAGGKVNATISNGGNVHVVPTKVSLKVLGREDALVSERPLEAWYVLAGTTRKYEVALSKDDCAKAEAIVVEATAGRTPLSARIDASGACNRPR